LNDALCLLKATKLTTNKRTNTCNPHEPHTNTQIRNGSYRECGVHTYSTNIETNQDNANVHELEQLIPMTT